MSKVYLVTSRIALIKEKGAMYDCKKKLMFPQDVFEAIKEVTHIQEEAQEVFGIICVDTKNKIIAVQEISRGALNTSIVHPREVFKAALLHNAASIFVFHNHPSGDCEPSSEDINITKRLIEAGKLLGIELLDHIIVGDEDSYLSMKERGLI